MSACRDDVSGAEGSPPSSSSYRRENSDGDVMMEEGDDGVMAEDGDGSEDGDSSDDRGSSSGGKRPHHTFMNLIAMSIMSSPKKMMVLPEIYEHIQKNFPFYGEDNKRGWQNAVRHNLSLHDCFVKVPRYKVDAPTTSCYWRLSDEARDLYERGESLKRKGAYRRKGGPRGVCFRAPPTSIGHSAHTGGGGGGGGDPYAKQHLYSSSWRIRQPNGSYPLRLDAARASSQSTSARHASSSAALSSALDWTQSRAPYGFSPAHDRQRAPTTSGIYENRYPPRHRQDSLITTRADRHPLAQATTFERGDGRHVSSHDAVVEVSYDRPSRPSRFARSDQSSRHFAGKLTFDRRAGLRRFAPDGQGRVCQVETFRSDRWRYDRRSLDLMLSQRRHTELIGELCRDVQEAFDAVAETMRVIAEGSGDATEAQARKYQRTRPDHVTAWDNRQAARRHRPEEVERPDVILSAGHGQYYMTALASR